MPKNLLLRGFGLLLIAMGLWGAEEVTPESRVQALMKTKDFPQALTLALEQSDHAASLAERLQLIREAANAARQGGLTRTFMAELKKSKEARQDAALSNLVLMAAYRALGDEQAEDVPLRELEASAKLTVEEWLQLAEMQMKGNAWGAQHWQQALTSLQKAAQMDKDNARVRNALALWQVAFGNTDEGVQSFIDLVQQKKALPEEAETMAMTLCERQQWRQAAQLLAPMTQEAPVSNRLLYLAAVCLEEAGQTKAALEKFKTLMERVKTDALAAPLPAHEAKNKLPEDVQALLSVWSFMPNAYQYRSGKDASPLEADVPRRRLTYVALPDTPRAAYSLTLLHLRKLARHGDAKGLADVTAFAKANGMERAEEFMDIDVSDNGLASVTPQLLSQHPEDVGLHLLWLSTHSWLPPGQDEIATLEHCVKLLEKDFPVDTFLAALMASRLDTPQQAEWRKRTLELFRKLKNEAFVDYSTTSLVTETRTWPEAKEWRAVLIDTYTTWREAMKALSDASRAAVTQALLQALMDDGRLEEYVRVLDDETKHPVSVEEAGRGRGLMFGGGMGMDGDPLLDPPLFPNYLLRWPYSLIQALRIPVSSHFNWYPATPPDVLRQQDAAVAKAAHLATNPLLRLMLLRLVDPNAATDEITHRLTAADASQAEWLIGGWLANEKDSTLAAERLAHAAKMPMDATAQRIVDAALVHCACVAKTMPEATQREAREAALRLMKDPLTARGGQDLVAGLDRLVLHAESQELARNPPVNSRGWSYDQLAHWIPYNYVIAAHVSAKQMDLAQQAYVDYLRSETPKLTQENIFQMFQEVTENLTFKKLLPREALLKRADPGENAPISERLAFAGVAELLGDEALAMREYKAVAEVQPWRQEPHLRLAALFTTAHQTDGAVQELQKVEPRLQENLIQEWRGEVASYSKATPEKKTAIHDVLLLWIKALGADPKTQLANSQVFTSLSELLQQSGEPDSAMLHESLAVRGLDETGLALLAHEALKKGDDLGKLAGDAARILQGGKRTDNNFAMGMSNNREGGHYPRPALVLLWNAWQKEHPQDVETTIMPLAQKALYPDEIRALRLAADLFFVPEDQFPKAAKAFGNDPAATHLVLGTEASHFYPGGPEDFVISVHQKRKLRVSLAPVFVSWVEKESGRYLTFEPVTRYLAHAGLSREDTAQTIRLIRDAVFHESAEERVKTIGEFLKNRYHNSEALSGATNAACESYVPWLSLLVAEPATFRAAMELAAEDHFTDDAEWMSSTFSQALGMNLKDEHAALSMMEAEGLLEDAPQFRAWKLGRNYPGSQAGQIANNLGSGQKKEIGQKVCALLKERQPRTFGADLMLMLINDGQPAPWDKIEGITVDFIKSHREQITQIPPEHRADVAAVFRTRLQRDWDHPEKLDADTRAILTPLRESDDNTLDETVRKILSADNWRAADLNTGDGQTEPMRAFFYLARKDERKALELAKKCVALLDAMDAENSRREMDGGSPPSYQWLERACATAATYRLLRPLLEEKGLMHSANWLSGALSTLCIDSMRPADKVPGFFEAMHFLDEAPQLDLEHLYRDDASSSLEIAVHLLTYSDGRKGLEAYLAQRQPRTFGTDLVAALLAREPAVPLQSFIHLHGGEFPKLKPGTAAALAGMIRRTLPERGDMRKDADFARVVQPLLDAEYEDAGMWCDRLLAQKHEGARQQSALWNEIFVAAPTLLEVIGTRDPQKAKQAFAHFLLIAKVGSGTRSNYMDPERIRSLLGGWLARCAGSPALVGPVLEALREGGDPEVLKATLDDFGRSSAVFTAMKKPGYVQAFFQALPFLADAEHFRAYKNDRLNGQGTLLEDIIVGLRQRRETGATTELDQFLAGLKPETFGGDLVKALRHRDRTPQLANFLKKHSADLVKLTPQGEEDLSILLSHNLTGWNRPETLDAELQTAAAPLIHSASVLTNARVLAILNATDIASTHFSEQEFMKQAPLLLHGLLDEDPAKARRFFTKVTELIEASPTQAELSRFPGSTPVAHWLASTADTPQLFKEVMNQAERANLRGDAYWLTGYLQNLIHEKSFHEPARTLAFLKETSLLEDAARFDPVSLRQADYGYHTLLELVVSEVGRRESTPELRKLMVKELPLTFGYELLFAMLADDPIAAVADFSVKHAADWKSLKPEHREAMAALLRPVLSRMAAAHAASLPQVNAALQLLLEAETVRQREVLDRLMKAKTSEEFLKGTNEVEPMLTWLFEWMLASGEGDVKAAFAHMAQLYQDRMHSSEMPPKSGLMFQLCALAESPQLRAYALTESASWPFKDDPHFREYISNRYAGIDRLWAGKTASAAKLSSLHFLDAAPTFDAFVYGSPRPGSALLVVVVELRSRKAAALRPEVLSWIKGQPATFGRDLMAALLADNPKTALPAFRQAQGEELQRLPEVQRGEIERVSARVLEMK